MSFGNEDPCFRRAIRYIVENNFQALDIAQVYAKHKRFDFNRVGPGLAYCLLSSKGRYDMPPKELFDIIVHDDQLNLHEQYLLKYLLAASGTLYRMGYQDAMKDIENADNNDPGQTKGGAADDERPE